VNSAAAIEGVIVIPLKRYEDSRGWLIELFRDDELPVGFEPTMAYISMTRPGVARGPHEHRDQTDGFAFLSGSFELHLWDNRAQVPSEKVVMAVGESNPVVVFVPPGVVHAYKNVGESDAFVVNFPDRLYAGWGKKEEVDEIRHESDENSPYKL